MNYVLSHMTVHRNEVFHEDGASDATWSDAVSGFSFWIQDPIGAQRNVKNSMKVCNRHHVLELARSCGMFYGGKCFMRLGQEKEL